MNNEYKTICTLYRTGTGDNNSPTFINYKVDSHSEEAIVLKECMQDDAVTDSESISRNDAIRDIWNKISTDNDIWDIKLIAIDFADEMNTQGDFDSFRRMIVTTGTESFILKLLEINGEFEAGTIYTTSSMYSEDYFEQEALDHSAYYTADTVINRSINCSVDTVSSMILAQAIAGIDVKTTAYRECITTVMDAISNQMEDLD